MAYPYVYLDVIYLKRNFAGNFENVAILIAIAVNEEGERKVIGACEGLREDKESWLSFLRYLKTRGLRGTQLFIGDKWVGLLEAVNTTYPDTRYQRCSVHFTRNVLSVVPRGQMRLVAAMLRAIHAQEDRQAAIAKSQDVIARLKEMKLTMAEKKIEDSITQTLEYMYFPREHCKKIRSNIVIERLNREIKRRTQMVGTFPDGGSALMPVCARLRNMESPLWGSKTHMNMKHLDKHELETQLGYEGA